MAKAKAKTHKPWEFQEGNQWWKERTTHGRKKKFTPETLAKACAEYLDYVEAYPLPEEKVFASKGELLRCTVHHLRAMTIQGLCNFLDIDITTWRSYAEQDDFSPVTTRMDSVMYDQNITGASADLLNANIIARKLGLADKKEVTAVAKISAEPLTEEEWTEKYTRGE